LWFQTNSREVEAYLLITCYPLNGCFRRTLVRLKLQQYDRDHRRHDRFQTNSREVEAISGLLSLPIDQFQTNSREVEANKSQTRRVWSSSFRRTLVRLKRRSSLRSGDGR